jgi:TRAP-type mannitol/chloroaromatic compound transport system permease small subunit
LQTLLKFSKAVDYLTERMGDIANWVVLITVVIGFYNVFVRYIGRFIGLNLSSNVYIELQWYLYSIIFFLGFGYILKHGINVRVDILYAQWSEKTQAMIDFWATLLLLVPFCIIGLYVTYAPVLTSWGLRPNGTWGTWEVSPDPSGLPRAPIKTMIIVAFVLMLLQAISQLIKYWAVIIGHHEVREILEAETERLKL